MKPLHFPLPSAPSPTIWLIVISFFFGSSRPEIDLRSGTYFVNWLGKSLPFLLSTHHSRTHTSPTVEALKYVFEAETIQRMELLVLSTLQWRMNPVTPISFFHNIVRRLGLKTHLHWEFLRRCERLLLSVIADSRFMCYLPSTLAAATMLHVIKEVEPFNHMECQNQLMGVLKISEDKVNECYMLILELSSWHGGKNQSCKRKHVSSPRSPDGVIDTSFSCDSSNESWAMTASVSSSPDPRFKRSRPHVQQM